MKFRRLRGVAVDVLIKSILTADGDAAAEPSLRAGRVPVGGDDGLLQRRRLFFGTRARGHLGVEVGRDLRTVPDVVEVRLPHRRLLARLARVRDELDAEELVERAADSNPLSVAGAPWRRAEAELVVDARQVVDEWLALGAERAVAASTTPVTTVTAAVGEDVALFRGILCGVTN